jgi:large subunit ribosomal protein L4
VDTVHLLAVDQLNTYDVLLSDDVVFTQGAYDAFVGTARSVPASAEAADPAATDTAATTDTADTSIAEPDDTPEPADNAAAPNRPADEEATQ